MNEVTFTGDGEASVPAWHWPADRADAPGILIVHEVFGLDPFVRSIGERVADLGWNALAPDLYSREGRPGPEPSEAQPGPDWDIETIRKAVREVPDRRALGDLEGALSWLGDAGGADSERLGVIGFCMGGCLAFLLGCRSRRPAAVVDYYGRIVYGELSKEKPVEPLEMALGLEVPFLGQFGGADASIPLEQVGELRERLSAFAKPHEIHVHEGLGHGFANPYRSSWNEAGAETAWERSVAFLRESLDVPVE